MAWLIRRKAMVQTPYQTSPIKRKFNISSGMTSSQSKDFLFAKNQISRFQQSEI